MTALTLTLDTLSRHNTLRYTLFSHSILFLESLGAILDLTISGSQILKRLYPALKYISLVTKSLENIFGIIFRGVRVDVCINRPLNISACNQHNFMIFISKCSLVQKDYNETGFESRYSHIYHLF